MIDFTQILEDHTPRDVAFRAGATHQCPTCKTWFVRKNAADHVNEKINERLAELLGRVKGRIDYNATDFGEVGHYVHTSFVKNIIDQLIKGEWL